MANVPLSFAINPYEHVRDLLDGTVRAEGIDFTQASTRRIEFPVA